MEIASLENYIKILTTPNIKTKLFMNEIIYNWVPLSNPSIIKTYTYYLDSNEYKNWNIEATDLLTDLDANIIYIVAMNKFNHYHHLIAEIVMILQLYLNYFADSTLDGKNFKLISSKERFTEPIMLEIFKLFDFKDKIQFIDNDKFYRGNILYIKHFGGKANMHYIGHTLPCLPRSKSSIFKQLIKKANEENDNKPFFKKLWISRRNDKNGWNDRIVTNMDTLSNILLTNDFKEMFFGTIDILYQIYLTNKASIIFGEPGTGLMNMVFANEHSKLLTLQCPCHNWANILYEEVCTNSNAEYYEYSDCEDDINHKDYNKDAFNRPYKINNIINFQGWLEGIIIK